MDPQLAWYLLLLALNVASTVVAVSACRRAASFDITHDFESLCAAVEQLQKHTRSEKMKRVRQGAPEQPEQPTRTTPMSHQELRALARRSVQ